MLYNDHRAQGQSGLLSSAALSRKHRMRIVDYASMSLHTVPHLVGNTAPVLAQSLTTPGPHGLHRRHL